MLQYHLLFYTHASFRSLSQRGYFTSCQIVPTSFFNNTKAEISNSGAMNFPVIGILYCIYVDKCQNSKHSSHVRTRHLSLFLLIRLEMLKVNIFTIFRQKTKQIVSFISSYFQVPKHQLLDSENWQHVSIIITKHTVRHCITFAYRF